MRGKLIVIEGIDCSGKETQANLLKKKLNQENIKCEILSFPMYSTPSGKIIGGPYLGKEYICESWFNEGVANVDAKVSTLYYAADRKYNIKKVEDLINSGINVILDRYVYSNLAHQGGKINDRLARMEMYQWIEKLEFDLLELPKADIKIFLHLSYEASLELAKNRKEKLDQLESSPQHLKMAENTYLEIAKLYNFKTIECDILNHPKKIDDINKELYEYVINKL